MHPTLVRQIKRFLGEMNPVPKGWEEFTDRVSQTYFGYEEDRRLIERSLEVSSREMMENNKQLQENTKELEEKVAEQDRTKKALFNIMDDLREEKVLTEREKAKDDILLQSIGDGIIAVDVNTRVLKINDAMRRLLNLNNEDVTDKSIADLFAAYTIEKQPINYDQRPEVVALKAGISMTETILIDGIDDKKRILTVIANPVMESGKVFGAIMIYRDVTKEKEVDRMKTEFISLASHQLRTPLSAIKWFTEMLLSGDAGALTPEQQDFAQNVADSTQRMIQLVNSLLNISRIESGRIIVDPKPTDLKELVQEVINDLRGKIEERRQNIVISVHQDLSTINIDARLIRQVYINLLTNAIKYTPKGGEISVIISRKDDYVISQVTDNGYGIPKADQPRLFQKFFRAENVAKIETDGTGLGLYLIKTIVESSGGKIWFVSEEGKGATFWFTLPLTGMQPKQGEVTLDG